MDDQSNHMPIQNLFEKFPHNLVLNTSPQPLSAVSILLRWFDHFQLPKYLTMLTAYIYDFAHKNPASQPQLGKLNTIIENLFTEIFNVSKANGFSHSGIEYLLNNVKVTRCMLTILADESARTPSINIGNKHTPLHTDGKLFSPAVRMISKSLHVMSFIDVLMHNLDQLLNGSPMSRTLLLLDSVDQLQSITFLVNSASKQAIVDSLSAPDGNMSNKQVECLLNW